MMPLRQAANRVNAESRAVSLGRAVNGAVERTVSGAVPSGWAVHRAVDGAVYRASPKGWAVRERVLE